MAGDRRPAKKGKRRKKTSQASVRRGATPKGRTRRAAKRRVIKAVADNSALATLPIDEKYRSYLAGLALNEEEKAGLIACLQGAIERLLDQKYGLDGLQCR